MTGIWTVVATAAVLGLAVWLAYGFAGLWADLRRTERDLAAERRLLDRYGGSLTWNEQTPVRGNARGLDVNPLQKD